jgi:hypothetical protein
VTAVAAAEHVLTFDGDLTILHAGDQVLLRMPRHITQEQAAEFRRVWAIHLPGIPMVVVGPDIGVSVMRYDDEEGSG